MNTTMARVLMGLLLLSALAEACTVPVFRYALDRWHADAYRFEVAAGWMEGAQAAKLRTLLGETATELEVVALAKGDSPARLLMPTEEEAVVWSGQPDAELSALFLSPMREKIAQELLSGASMVWVMVSSGSAEKDQEFEKRISARLSYLESVAAIPEQDPNDPESKLGPGPDLRVGFSFLKVARSDAKEQVFLKMLVGPAGAPLLEGDEPFAGVVFGRGRALGVWPPSELDEEGIDEVSLFLLGACSCRVKIGNPGWDIAMAIDWDTRLMASQMAADRKLEDSVLPVALSEEGEGQGAPIALLPEVVSFEGGADLVVPEKGNKGSVLGIVLGSLAVAAGLVTLYFMVSIKGS
jgi:hypothetical protein